MMKALFCFSFYHVGFEDVETAYSNDVQRCMESLEAEDKLKEVVGPL
jgi:hypothetical protein